MMIKQKTRSWSLRLIFAFAIGGIFAHGVEAQVSRPVDPRMDDINKLKDYNRILDGQEKDQAARRTKEQRMAVVNEAFKRLQILHNEMMAAIGTKDPAASQKAAATAEEVKLRATELNANLALPPLENSKDKQQKATAVDAAQPTIDDHYFALCQLIRDFVKHVNLSPTDPKAGVQARRDLAALVKRSDELILFVGVPDKT